MTADTADHAGNSVLGTLLMFYKPELVTIVQAQGVEPQDFWRSRQRIVWRAVLALHAKGVHVDHLTVRAFLEGHRDSDDRVMLERAGGEGFLAVCVDAARPAAFKDHAAMVARSGCQDRRQRVIAALALANERGADDETMAELYVQLGREIKFVDGQPKLRVVKDAAA